MRGFTDGTVVEAEGARVGLVSCLDCGQAIVLDPRDPVDMLKLHRKWHADQDRLTTELRAMSSRSRRQ